MDVAVFQGRLHLHQRWVSELNFTPLTRQASSPACCSHLKYKQAAASSREDCAFIGAADLLQRVFPRIRRPT